MLEICTTICFITEKIPILTLFSVFIVNIYFNKIKIFLKIKTTRLSVFFYVGGVFIFM